MSNWKQIAQIDDIPVSGARVVMSENKRIAVFRNAADEIFALDDHCPHKGGFLSQGIVHDKSVTCPLHNWKINLADGEALGPDSGCTGYYPLKIEANYIYIDLGS